MALIPTGAGLTTPILVVDNLYTLNAGQEVLSQPTTVSCGLELQSTTTAFCISRLTQAQINALTATNGMIVYNTTTNVLNYYINGVWTTNAGQGALVTPGVTTNTAIALWGNNVGTALTNSVVLVSGAGAVTGVTSLSNGNGAVATPSFNFTANTNTGMWSSVAHTIDFSTNGLEALQILPVVAAVNWLAISPSAANTPVLLSALGTDANISMELIPQGIGSVIVPVGAVATPSVVFVGRTTTGMFSSVANFIDFATNGLEAFQINTVANAVNWVRVTPSATTTPVVVSAQGTDANIGLSLLPKGTGGVIHPVGALATPSITFTADLGTGIFHSAANTIDFSNNGVESLQLLTAAVGVNYFTITPAAAGSPPLLSVVGADVNIGIELVTKGTGSVIVPVGAVTTPGIAFVGDLTTGIYHGAANTIDFSTNGLKSFEILTVGVAVNWLAVTPSATTTPVLLSALGTDVNIGIQLVAKGTGGVIHPVGAVATPSITFAGRTTTGMFSSAANTIDFSTNGLESLQIATVALAVNYLVITPSATTTPVLLSAAGTDANVGISLVTKGTGGVIVPAGTAANPGLVFTGDTTTGFYDVAAGTLGVSISGSQVSTVSAKGISLGGAAPTNAATNTISLAVGTAPTGVGATQAAFYTASATGAIPTLGIYSSGAIVSATGGGLTPDHNLCLVINGTTYYVPCKTTQT